MNYTPDPRNARPWVALALARAIAALAAVNLGLGLALHYSLLWTIWAGLILAASLAGLAYSHRP